MRALVLLLLVIASASASAEAVPEPEGFWSGPINSEVPATVRGGKVIHTEELAQLLKQDKPLVIDVSNQPKRPEGLAPEAPWLPLPQQVIPGSIWLPGAGIADIAPETDAAFRTLLTQKSGGDLDHLIVIYCHERCWLSWNAAKRAISYGYRHVHWFPEGVEGWRAAGNPTVTAKAWSASER